jgi:uncharacterized tellurite resistance protein B-like protein/predicted RNA-binding Zn-ribbon protein involved in translation (DUF1610 family)
MLFSLFSFIAQAGGGGSFGSGGGGGGGFSGGSGGGGGGGAWLVYLIFRYPYIGIPVVIIVLLAGAKGSKKGVRVHHGRVIRQTRSRREKPRRISTEPLKAIDPDFDETRLLARVGVAFRKAQKSWCDQDLTALRPFVSDGIYERFSLQIAEQRRASWRQSMQGLGVGQLSVVALDLEGAFEAVTIYIPFECSISKLDTKGGGELPGSRLPETHFAECWTFLRRRGTKTQDKDGLIEGQCPNCGAQLEMARTARCSVCDCEALSGQFDWVLTEITQASVWQPKRGLPASLASYIKSDPDLSLALLEDRASVAFWRRRVAEERGEVGPLLGIATEALTSRLQAAWQSPGRLVIYTDAAVGSVETVGILKGKTHDRALVEVIWDGNRLFSHNRAPAGRPGPRTLERDLFVFTRATGQTTRWKTTFTTAHCPHCGGVDTGDLSDVCPWCDEPRRGKRDTWLLEDILPRSSDEAHELLGSLVSIGAGAPAGAKPVSRQLLTWAASLAGADNQLGPKERDALARIARRAGLTPNEIDSLTPSELGLETWEATEPPAGPVDSTEARLWLTELVALALADGHIDRTEERWLLAAAGRLGFAQADLRITIKKEEARLYREAKAART